MRHNLRRIGFFLLAVAAVVVFFVGAPSVGESDIDDALFTAELNEESAEGAPQQSVVNGWVARDLLEVIARDQGDERVPALLLIGVLAFVLHATTQPPAVAAGTNVAPAS